MLRHNRFLTPLAHTWEIFSRPQAIFAELAEASDPRPAWTALAVTSVLFSASSVVSYYQKIPMAEKPLWLHPAYLLFQAGAMPLILGLGCLLCCGIAMGVGKLLGADLRLKKVWALVLPAILVPTWLMLWPADMAVSLGVLSPDLTGFPGFWVRELAPALNLIYMLFLLSLALNQALKRTWREAFALAFFSLTPALGFWALILR